MSKLLVGRKFDKEKLRWELMPTKALAPIIRVLMMGSEKYDDDNWKYVKECKRRYYAAAMRHLTEWFDGDAIDSESGESHLAHAGACIIFLIWHEMNQTKEFLNTTPEIPFQPPLPETTKEKEDPLVELVNEKLEAAERVVQRFDTWLQNFKKSSE